MGSFIKTICPLMHHVLCKVFWQNIKSRGGSRPPTTQIWCPGAFPKTKITFEREEISDHCWDSGKHDGEADGNWENFQLQLPLLLKLFYIFCEDLSISINSRLAGKQGTSRPQVLALSSVPFWQIHTVYWNSNFSQCHPSFHQGKKQWCKV